MNQFVSKRKPSETPIQHLGYGNMSRYLYPILPTLWRNQFSSATLILTTSLHLLLELWKIQLLKAKRKKNLFQDIETTVNIKLGSILEKLTQRHNRREQADLDDCFNEIFASLQFLQIQKNQLIDLQESLKHYCNVLRVFGFNSAKYDLNSIKSYLLPIPVNERDIEPTVIKKANQFISFNFDDSQLLDILNFLGGATSLVHS